MKVTVEYFAQARAAAGLVREIVEVPAPCTAQALVARLARDRGNRLAALLLTEDGQLSGSVLLAVGERQVFSNEPLALSDGDEVLVMPAVSGG